MSSRKLSSDEKKATFKVEFDQIFPTQTPLNLSDQNENKFEFDLCL